LTRSKILTGAATTDCLGPKAAASVPSEDLLAAQFQANREEFLSLIRIHLSPKLERRIDPKDVLQEAFTRARDGMT
jgi:hypothetical protein